jgi:hypothetical protein
MKRQMYLFFSILTVVLVGCNTKKTTKNDKTDINSKEAIVKPLKNYLSKAEFKKNVTKEINEILSLSNDKLMDKATEIVTATKKAIKAISDNNFSAAKKQIEIGIGKVESLTALNPELAFAPINFTIETNDLVTDISVIKKVSKTAEEALEEGKIQEARDLLQGLRSDISIKKFKLPIATYPDALKQALVLTKEKKYTEASELLQTTLNTVVIENKTIPLPLLRAERMLEEVDNLMNKDNFKKEDLKVLLENANYEISFAEALGYGKKDKEFKELHEAIKDISSQIMEDSNFTKKDLIKQLKSKLKNFKIKIS